MSDLTLLDRLREDVEAAFPTTNALPDPTWNVAVLRNADAPVVTISRDPRAGPQLTPVFFIAAPNDEELTAFMVQARERTGGVAALTHQVAGAHMVHFLMVPLMYNMFAVDTFLEALTSYLSAPEFAEFAWFRDDCEVLIAHRGNNFKAVPAPDRSFRVTSEPSPSAEEIQARLANETEEFQASLASQTASMSDYFRSFGSNTGGSTPLAPLADREQERPPSPTRDMSVRTLNALELESLRNQRVVVDYLKAQEAAGSPLTAPPLGFSIESVQALLPLGPGGPAMPIPLDDYQHPADLAAAALASDHWSELDRQLETLAVLTGLHPPVDSNARSSPGLIPRQQGLDALGYDPESATLNLREAGITHRVDAGSLDPRNGPDLDLRVILPGGTNDLARFVASWVGLTLGDAGFAQAAMVVEPLTPLDLTWLRLTYAHMQRQRWAFEEIHRIVLVLGKYDATRILGIAVSTADGATLNFDAHRLSDETDSVYRARVMRAPFAAKLALRELGYESDRLRIFQHREGRWHAP